MNKSTDYKILTEWDLQNLEPGWTIINAFMSPREETRTVYAKVKQGDAAYSGSGYILNTIEIPLPVHTFETKFLAVRSEMAKLLYEKEFK